MRRARWQGFVGLALALCALGGGTAPADLDRDGIANADDNCPEVSNVEQLDVDGDGAGNACDTCVELPNPGEGQADADEDGRGDVCDLCADTDADVPVPGEDEVYRTGVDADGCSVGQRCPCETEASGLAWRSHERYRACVRRHSRILRRRTVIDVREMRLMRFLARRSECGARERSDDDRDGDGVLDDGDETGIPGDLPCTGGVRVGCDDNCPRVFNREQRDRDGDGRGDACDADADGDGIDDAADNCPFAANETQEDADLDEVGDACDKCADTPEDEDVDGRGCAVDQTPGGATSTTVPG